MISPRKLSIWGFLAVDNLSKKFGWKTRENVVFLDFLAIDNFDFTRKIVKKKKKKKLAEKLVKMLGFCQNWIFGQNFDFWQSVNHI